MIGIYKITSPSGKVYIGQSWNISKRFYDYKWGCPNQTALNRSFKKYGIVNHIFEIVHELPVDTDQLTLNNYETFYWQQHLDYGFKMLNMREPGSNGKMSNEAKEKMSAKRKELLKEEEFAKKNNEQLARMSAKKKGVTNTADHTSKIVAFHTGRRRSQDTCDRISAGKIGKKITRTDEHNKNISLALRGKSRPELKGRKFSEERKANMRKGMKGKKKRRGIINFSFGHIN
jgi:group I intron endonuclease